jgi:hypothetical protein
MSELVADCPRCDAINMTFDLLNQVIVDARNERALILETFCICRNCRKSTIFVVGQKNPGDERTIKSGLNLLSFSVNKIVTIKGYVGLQDQSGRNPPEHLPADIETIFNEGASCLAIGCNNAAVTMFRLCLDMATQSLLPETAEGLNNRVRRNLGLRLPWLFDNNILPEALRELSTCIKADGNVGAHEGTLEQHDASDTLDFTYILLERLFTEPERIKLAAERRLSRSLKV